MKDKETSSPVLINTSFLVMYFISSSYLNSNKFKGREQSTTTVKLEVILCCQLWTGSEAGVFGMTVKPEEAEHTPTLISTVHPFCIMSTSLGLRVWQGEGQFILLEDMSWKINPNEMGEAKGWKSSRNVLILPLLLGGLRYMTVRTYCKTFFEE